MPFPSQCMPHAGSVHLCRMSTFIVFLLRSSEMHCTCTFKIHQNSTNPCIVRVCILHLSFRACKCTCCKVFQQVLIASCGAVNDIFDSHLFWNCDDLWWMQRKSKKVDCRRSNDFPLKRLEETGRKQHPKVDKNCFGDPTVFVRMQCLCALQQGTHFMLCYCMLGPLPHSHLKAAVAPLSVSPSKKVKHDGWGKN